MTEASATPQSIAARVNWAEQAVQWLLDNRGSGGEGDPETTQQLQRLFRCTVGVGGATASGVWNGEEPWNDTLIYDNTGATMHISIFGLNPLNAIACQDGKGFYGRVSATMNLGGMEPARRHTISRSRRRSSDSPTRATSSRSAPRTTGPSHRRSSETLATSETGRSSSESPTSRRTSTPSLTPWSRPSAAYLRTLTHSVRASTCSSLTFSHG